MAQGTEPYKPHRFDEDYQHLRDPGCRLDAWDTVKFVPLDADARSYLTLGGEVRARFEHYDAVDFGVRGRSSRSEYLLDRTLLHADVHLGPHFRFFGQFGAYGALGGDEALGPTQRNKADLAQAFVDADLPLGSSAGRITVRGGRQEMSFGSSRLVSAREGPNVRLAFDGVRAFWRSSDEADAVRVDVFATRPVQPRPGVFDDRSGAQQAFWGVYGTGPATAILPSLRADFYYLGFKQDRSLFPDVAGEQRRHTIGTRLFGATADWDWDIEAAYQFGSVRKADIRAWTVASDVGFTMADTSWTPRLGLRADVASGDSAPGDGRLGTFNPLFPKLPYFSDASLIVPANLMDVQPNLTLHPTPTLTLLLGWNILWRHRSADAVYATPFAPLPGTTGGSRFIGQQVQVRGAWQATRHIEITAAYVRFFAGSTIKRADGRDVDFALLSAAYKF